jgi:uncharacterized protein YndB with AHSA1/START domain
MKKIEIKSEPEARAAMLIRKPVREVFEALVNPDITTKFWFTKSNGRVEEGKTLEWRWEMYDLTERVKVRSVKKDQLISLAFPGEKMESLVEINFSARDDGNTFVSVVNKNWDMADPAVIDHVVGATEGWTLVLAAMKALLEHGIALRVVSDRFPDGLS